jgi:Ca2+-transporting ATPase
LSAMLQVLVIYTPFLQQAFSTVSLTFNDWVRCVTVGSSVLWLRELSKVVIRRMNMESSDNTDPLIEV